MKNLASTILFGQKIGSTFGGFDPNINGFDPHISVGTFSPLQAMASPFHSTKLLWEIRHWTRRWLQRLSIRGEGVFSGDGGEVGGLFAEMDGVFFGEKGGLYMSCKCYRLICKCFF